MISAMRNCVSYKPISLHPIYIIHYIFIYDISFIAYMYRIGYKIVLILYFASYTINMCCIVLKIYRLSF